jgi:hypothetical protein
MPPSSPPTASSLSKHAIPVDDGDARAAPVQPSRPDREGKKYIGIHVDPPEHRRIKVVTAKLGWTMDAFVRYGLFAALEKLEKMAEENGDKSS